MRSSGWTDFASALLYAISGRWVGAAGAWYVGYARVWWRGGCMSMPTSSPPPGFEQVDGPSWTPVFPAQRLRDEGQGWASGFACDGQDRHALSISMRQAAVSGLVGVALIAVDLVLHF